MKPSSKAVWGLLMGNRIQLLRGSTGKVPVELYLKNNKYHAKFPFDLALKDHIKAMKGARWQPDLGKIWTFTKCPRNDFQLAYLLGMDPYVEYDKPLIDINPNTISRPLFEHQVEILRHMLTRRFSIVAAEMGTGKSLAGIELIERIDPQGPVWWIGPKLTLAALRLEFEKWEFDYESFNLTLATYDWVKKTVAKKYDVPQIILFDESTKLKTHSTQRTRAAMKVVEAVRTTYVDDGIVTLMSGRPAPNSPGDWWSQCEVACPGFLKEGKFPLFVSDLCIQEQMTTDEGVHFNKHVTWLDDPHKCNECGRTDEDHFDNSHSWTPSANKIARLEKRLKGLVLTIFKKDCLDLPEMTFRKIYCPISDKASRLAKRVAQLYSGADLLNRLRQLSDGFQYVTETDETSSKPCKFCDSGRLEDNGVVVTCHNCDGKGNVFKKTNVTKPFDTPKTRVVADLLDEFDEYGRFGIYAPMYGSLDRVIETARRLDWEVMKMDGRGVLGIGENLAGCNQEDMLRLFQQGPQKSGIKRILFVGNQESASMGLTLTATPALAFYSNSFKGEARQQAIARIHRPGSIGAQIIDIIHLPQDEFVLDKLDGKSQLQDLSLGKFDEELKEYIENWKPKHEEAL